MSTHTVKPSPARIADERDLLKRYARHPSRSCGRSWSVSVHASRAKARRALFGSRGALRGPAPDRLARPRPRGGPLRPRARDDVLDLRRTDHPRASFGVTFETGPGRSICPAGSRRRSSGSRRRWRSCRRVWAARRRCRMSRSASDIRGEGPRGVERIPDALLAIVRMTRRSPRTAKSTSLERAHRRPGRQLEIVEGGVEVQEAIESLPERDREVLRLRFVEDLTQREIADGGRRVADAGLAHPQSDRRPASRRGRRGDCCRSR